MQKKRWPLIVVIGALGLACAGVAAFGVLIGGIALESSSGPNGAVTRYYEAVRDGDYASAHAQLSPGFAAESTPDDLRDVFAASDAQEGRITEITVQNTRIDDNQATVEATIGREQGGGPVVVRLIQIEDRWLIDDFGAS
jgi:hypothetical protein